MAHQPFEQPFSSPADIKNVRAFSQLPKSYQIETMKPRHLDAVRSLFCESFPDNLMVKFGPGAVSEFLKSYILIPGGCGYVSLYQGEVVGFVLGSENAPAFRNTWLRRRWSHLGLHVIRGLIGAPHLAWRLLRNIHPYLSPGRLRREQTVRSVDAEPVPPASLILLAVDSGHRRRRIGDQLTNAFLQIMRHRGVDRVKLNVAATNRAALAFYHSQGWQIAERYEVPDGGFAYRLTYDLSASSSIGSSRSA